MEALEQPRFETEIHESIYEYVERNGAVSVEDIERELSVDRAKLREAIEELTDEAYLETEDGYLRISIDTGAEIEHTIDDLTFGIRPATGPVFGSSVTVAMNMFVSRKSLIFVRATHGLRKLNPHRDPQPALGAVHQAVASRCLHLRQ